MSWCDKEMRYNTFTTVCKYIYISWHLNNKHYRSLTNMVISSRSCAFLSKRADEENNQMQLAATPDTNYCYFWYWLESFLFVSVFLFIQISIHEHLLEIKDLIYKLQILYLIGYLLFLWELDLAVMCPFFVVVNFYVKHDILHVAQSPIHSNSNEPSFFVLYTHKWIFLIWLEIAHAKFTQRKQNV